MSEHHHPNCLGVIRLAPGDFCVLHALGNVDSRCSHQAPVSRSLRSPGANRTVVMSNRATFKALSFTPLMILLLLGCDRAPTANSPPPPAVTVAQPLHKQITEWDEYTGRFVAVETVEIRARVSGFHQFSSFQGWSARQARRPAVRHRSAPLSGSRSSKPRQRSSVHRPGFRSRPPTLSGRRRWRRARR